MGTALQSPFAGELIVPVCDLFGDLRFLVFVVVSNDINTYCFQIGDIIPEIIKAAVRRCADDARCMV